MGDASLMGTGKGEMTAVLGLCDPKGADWYDTTRYDSLFMHSTTQVKAGGGWGWLLFVGSCLGVGLW